MANHVTELDFALLGAAFKAPLVFVIGDTLLRAPVVGWLLVALFGAIGKHKGVADATTAMGILRRLRGGQNVCLFPEGNTCFDGRTGPFPEATGSLARAVGATLVTYRISGAHLALPRWGKGIRKGRTFG
ncbi:MAG: 1-acyl-sn-glycerol-3-phosphate acyltransferase, partial [Clostridiales bacterium]|nr:1-acyl-sn-glycerol-3-phosphate acyltransferase [Clostridiales bacterium]